MRWGYAGFGISPSFLEGGHAIFKQSTADVRKSVKPVWKYLLPAVPLDLKRT